MPHSGFKTCQTCTSYKGCKTNTLLKKYIETLLPPEVSPIKITTTATFLAESCPEYFAWKDAEK